MAINSWLNPKITDKISECVPFIQKALVALLKMEPASISDVPTGAKRMTLPNASQWKIEKYDGSNWVAAGKLMHDVDTVDGYHAAITPAKNTIAVRNSSGVLQDSITGNAATATKAAALSEINPLSMGGTGSNTAAGARTNLGVPPIAHSSTANTYGLGSDTNYGHLKLSDAVDGTESVANGTAATPKAVKDVNDSAVHLAGSETITGAKTFLSVPRIKGISPSIQIINTDVVKGTPPSASKLGTVLTLIESEGYSNTSNVLGVVQTAYRTNGTIDTRLYAYKPEAGATASAFLGVEYPASGYPYATCPTPKDASGNIDTSDNSTKIATTQWVKASSLPLTGGTVDGNIAFPYGRIGSEDARKLTYVTARTGTTDFDNGAFLTLEAGDDTVNGGGNFSIVTRGGDGVEGAALVGTRDGYLFWNNSEIFLPVGSVFSFAGSYDPQGCLICNGAAISRTTYSKLFNIIGTVYGEGDGSTTFNLPNLIDRFIHGHDTAGIYVNAGLPNITGTSQIVNGVSTISSGTGAIIKHGNSGRAAQDKPSGYGGALYFDASRSNTIYGSSTTVQPPALTMRYYIKY